MVKITNHKEGFTEIHKVCVRKKKEMKTNVSANEIGCKASMAHIPQFCICCLVSGIASIVTRSIAVKTITMRHVPVMTHHHYETHSSHHPRDQETSQNMYAPLRLTTKNKTNLTMRAQVKVGCVNNRVLTLSTSSVLQQSKHLHSNT